jgi:hypothetical protein
MSGVPQGCYVYDSYLDKCKSWHPPEWWEFINVFSIVAVGAAFVVFLYAIAWLASKTGAFK